MINQTGPEKLFCINQEIFKYSKKYLLGVNREIICIFSWLLNEGVYVDGFIDDNFAGEKIFNKNIVTLKEIEERNTVILLSHFEKMEENNYNYVVPFLLNEKINKKSIVIYGAGIIGSSIINFFKKNDIKVEKVIDSDEKKEGMDFCDVKVYSKNILMEIEADTSIVEAGKGYLQIDDIVRECKPDLKRFYWNYSLDSIVDIFIDSEKKYPLNINFHILQMCQSLEDKKLIIYGTTQEAKKLAHLCQLLDFNIEYFIDERITDNKFFEDKEIKNVIDTLYDDNIYILIANDNYQQAIKNLELLGYIYAKDFAIGKMFRADKFLIRRSPLDVNLAYTFIDKEKFPGYMIYGKNRESDYKILVLGGSTSDGNLYPFKSWVEYLYDEIKEHQVTIYNGAVAGYTSGQELIKLIRDVSILKPNMVLVFDGYNEIYTEQQYPFAPNYLQQIFRFVNARMESSDLAVANEGNNIYPIKGIASEDSRFINWLNNIKKMNAICTCLEIKFFSFLQPMLGSKMQKSQKEKLIWLSAVMPLNEERDIKDFRKQAELQKIEENKFIFNLSDIFDKEDEVYMDGIHVYENGNKIIAKEIYDRISEYL